MKKEKNMKRFISCFLAIIMITCSFSMAFASTIFAEDESGLVALTRSLPVDPAYELVSAQVIKSDDEFTCIETVYQNKNAPETSVLSIEDSFVHRICIRHTWYRNSTPICCLELYPTFYCDYTYVTVDRTDLTKNFEQYEASCGYGLGSLVTHNATSPAEKATFAQTYSVHDRYGNV